MGSLLGRAPRSGDSEVRGGGAHSCRSPSPFPPAREPLRPKGRPALAPTCHEGPPLALR